MKKLQIFGIIIFATTIFLISCGDSNDCFDVEFGLGFVAEAEEEYCFNDNTILRVDSLINAFCPCDAVCIWEGQMEVYMTWIIDGQSHPYIHNNGRPELDTLLFLPIDINISSDLIQFVEPCDSINPSPLIVSTELTIDLN